MRNPWVYGTQQDSGSVAVLSRGDYGAITFLDWDPVAAYEFGYILPNPLDPNIVYAGGEAHGLVLLNRANRQVQTISPNLSRDGNFRLAQNPPLAFSPQDPHVFYEGTQFLLETRDAGKNWNKISPDLTERPGGDAVNQQENQEATASTTQDKKLRTREATETLTPPNRSAINCFSPSPVAPGEIWVGTTNGLVQLTKDGGATWTAISPSGLSQFAMISMLEASHFEAASAYVAVDRHEENDFKPHIYRTHDGGKSWQEADFGIPDGNFVRVVREDPTRKGLLYAGTENAAYVSFNDGDHWSPLQLNMPTTSVRDLQVQGSDLVAATYGRAFWILDDLSPLRQISAQIDTKALQQTFLFRPGKALRVQADLNGDTPLPPEMPAGQNPPNGALIDYYLKSVPTQDISLAIYDHSGQLVRKFSTKPGDSSVEPPPNVPDYWLARPEPLTKNAGMNRFLWDLRYAIHLSIYREWTGSSGQRCPNRLLDLRRCLSDNSESDSITTSFPGPSDVELGYTPNIHPPKNGNVSRTKQRYPGRKERRLAEWRSENRRRENVQPTYVPFECPYCADTVKIKLVELHKLRACVDKKAAELYRRLDSGELREANPWRDKMRKTHECWATQPETHARWTA